MPFFILLGLVAVIVWMTRLSGRLNDLTTRLLEIEQVAKDARARADQIAQLRSRVAALEAAATQVAADTAPAPAPVTSAPASVPAPPPVPIAVTETTPAVPVFQVPASEPPPAQVPAEPAPPPAPIDDAAWEVTVGGSWLNKIGVLVFVIGLALLLGYSMAHVGPAGRIAIGFVVSFAMLATGVTLERREEYRTYAYGLIAGGWAGTYFTTYAMRAIEAARVLDSDVVAIAALSAVAAAMVWHSLRYRSQEVTALAYVVAYATLALTPLHVFSLAASVPLAVSVLVVAHRFGWPRIQILGIVFTYGLYIMRGQAFGFGALGDVALTPYFALATYWILFEAADLAALWRRRETGAPAPPVFLLNAAGLIGAGLLQLPWDSPVPLSTFLLAGGMAYLGSAVARARLARGGTSESDAIDDAVQGSHQGASALAVALVAWAIELRFTGSRLVLALLMEAELVFLSGLILGDRRIRGIGSALAILVGLQAIWLVGAIAPASLPALWSAQAPVVVVALTALVWYANREWLRSRQIPLIRHEWHFTFVATYLVVLIARAEWQIAYASLAALFVSILLLEAGFRRGREYRYQAFVVGFFNSMLLLLWFGAANIGRPRPASEAWIVLLSAMALAYVAAWRLAPSRGAQESDRLERVIAAATAGALGTAFLVMLQWIVVAPDYVALTWTATAAIIAGASLYWKVGGLRWQVYPLLALALVRALRPVLEILPARPVEIASALVVIVSLYAFSLAVRTGMTHARKGIAEIEDAVRMAMSIAATVSLVLLIYMEVRPTLVTVTWGIHGAVLLATGFPARERLLRLSGLGVLLACIARLFVFDLPQLEELARIISFVALGAVLLSVSWIYTRYRAQLQKFL